MAWKIVACIIENYLQLLMLTTILTFEMTVFFTFEIKMKCNSKIYEQLGDDVEWWWARVISSCKKY